MSGSASVSGADRPAQDPLGLRAARAELGARALWRDRIELLGAQGALVNVNGRSLLNFASNDYLGLAADGRVVAAFKAGADRFGVGAGASAQVCGWTRAHAELEERIASFTGRERALLFGSGYLANLALGASGLLGSRDHLIEDRLNHASLIDAARISGARLRRYPHLDVAAATRLMAAATGRKLVLTDGIFSMNGDIAPLASLVEACRENDAVLAVDDAHGLGVLGATGAGVLEMTGLDATAVPLLIGTFGKALGTAGAFVAGARDWVEILQQRARTHVYTTAPPPAVACATVRALDICAGEPHRRRHLQEMIAVFRTGAGELGLPLLPSITPIQPLVLGTAARAVEVGAGLRRAGILVAVVRPPTVPEGTSRLRITLTAAHDRAQVERLLDELARVLSGASPA